MVIHLIYEVRASRTRAAAVNYDLSLLFLFSEVIMLICYLEHLT